MRYCDALRCYYVPIIACNIFLGMPTKRGRPQSSDDVDDRLARQREAWRRQQRNRRARITTASSARRPPTHDQLQQGERIINLTVTEEEEAAVTLTQLGLRVQGMALAQDAVGRQEQELATAVDEHHALYQSNERPHDREASHTGERHVGFFRRFIAPRNTTPEASGSQQRSLSQFFRSLPARDPSLANPLSPEHLRSHVSTPLRELQRSANDYDVSRANSDQQDNVDLGVGRADVIHEDEAVWQPLDTHDTPEDTEEIVRVGEEQSDSPVGSDDESAVSFVSERSGHEDVQSDVEPEASAVEFC